MRRTILSAVVVMLSACAGGQKKEAAKPEPVAADDEAKPDSGPQMIDSDKYDDIVSTFDEKRPAVARCWTQLANEGKVDTKAGGSMTLNMDISADGKISNIVVASDELKNTDLEKCVTEMVGAWKVPAPNVATPFSYTYGFRSL